MADSKNLLEQVRENPFDRDVITNAKKSCGYDAAVAAVIAGLGELEKNGSPGCQYANGLIAMLRSDTPGMGGLDAYLSICGSYNDIVQER